MRVERRVAIRLLGGVEVDSGSGGVAGRRAFLRPLVYLALVKEGRVARAQLAAHLWPESPEALARSTLRKNLFLLRRHLPDLARCLTLSEATLAWCAPEQVEVDTWTFQRLVEDADLAGVERAVGLYRGDLAPAWEDEWLDYPRAELRSGYLRALRRLVDEHLVGGALGKAVWYAERLHREEPLDEEGLRLLVRVHLRRGDRGSAQRVYRHAVERLRQELGCEPDPETLALAKAFAPSSPGRRTVAPASAAGPAADPPSGPVLSVPRTAEIDRFRCWLHEEADGPRILLIQGPAGCGKTALLQAFAGEAERQGLPTVVLDARAMAGTERLLLAGLGGEDRQTALARREAEVPVVFLDHSEELGALGVVLREEILPRLGAPVRVVVAGRYGPLPGLLHPVSPWRSRTQVLRLRALSSEEAQAYLRGRGLADPERVAAIAARAGGNLLALSLAADLVREAGEEDGRAVASRWHLAAHDLATYLLKEVADDEELRQALEAASLLRHFHEGSLAALTPLSDARRVFGRMVQLSVVRPTERGLALHDDVRTIVSQDLRWRNPERWEALRRAALAYYREQQRLATAAEERAFLLEEQLFLTHDARVHGLLFQDADVPEVWLERGTEGDGAEVRRLWREWLAEERSGELLDPQVAALGSAHGEMGLRLRLVRHRDGSVLGLSGVLPVCRRTLPIFLASENTAAFVAARFGEPELASLPETPQEATAFHVRLGVLAERRRRAVTSHLLRDVLALFAENHCYYVTTSLPEPLALFRLLGLRRLEAATWAAPGSPVLHETFELDLTQPDFGFSEWAERLAAQAMASTPSPFPGVGL